MDKPPAVSVVVPVYNAAPYLDACLASICTQDFDDFEVVVFDDGSTDGSAAKLSAWADRDRRLRVVRGTERLGAAKSSNRVVELARAPLIARIDADDIMLPGRLAAQTGALTAHAGAVLVGTLAWTIDAHGRRVRAPDLARVLRASAFAPFPHSSVMFRRAAWERIGGYRESAEKWEDVEFFLRMAASGEVWVIPHPFVEYRQSMDSTRLVDGIERIEQSMDTMIRATQPSPPKPPGRIAPAAYRHIGATLLWAGGRPKLMGRILTKAQLRANRESMALLIWAAFAQTAPGLLRTALRVRLSLGNRSARSQLASLDAVRWEPNSPIRPVTARTRP